jgi:hypothetical protein
MLYVYARIHTLQCFQHLELPCSEHSPYHWNLPKYGAKIQYADSEDSMPLLDATDKQWVQEIMGTFLFYA